ncbi:MAG: VWA domain-containing protein [Armatimonadota bacterium]|nr:VWA domain-containing protein [Armatimonadota bacterium]MDR7428076.1 VWA domain-containing protein [Armatimonadota bacterium]MDR7464590.1 VWA domain-containing protein [Armatimonadota bacterium]MDR7469678.1 VWA domain-containing protein [Armatimonadota bacterium]MDR7475890.1 VWA domain-containing protein [Armatimonadota bacterium]
MSFLWPQALAGFLLVAGLGAGYARAAFRSPRAPLSHTQTPLLTVAASAGCRICPHLPAALFLAALAALVVALSRPVVPWPTARGWPVALVIDVSRSMEETDIPPSRIEAAKAAAADLVRGLPRSTPAAVITFGNYASVVVPLTTDRARLREGIMHLTTQLRTQLGTGLAEGVRLLTEDSTQPAIRQPRPVAGEPRAVAILLSDGRASDGIPPLEAARMARERGVRVYTVGMGTSGDPTQFRSGYWGVLDEPTLRAVAEETGGRYFHASSMEGLRQVYRELARVVGWTRTPQEASALAAAGALFFVLAAVALRTRHMPLG